MKKALGIILILVGIVLWTSVQMPAVKKLREYPTSMLTQEVKGMQIQLDAAKLSGGSSDTSHSINLQKEKLFYQIELARRNFGLNWLGIIFVLLGSGILALQFLNRTESVRRIAKVRVTEVMPTEEYVDEGEHYRKSQEAFPSKDAALAWFESDPLRICNYCGAPAMKPVRGQADEVQHTTFYKKVPNTAKDLRIVLGSSWFVRPAAELQCDNCNQRVIR